MDYRLKIGEEIITAQCGTPKDGHFSATINGNEVLIFARRISSHQIQLMVDGKAVTVFTNGSADAKEMFVDGRSCTVVDADLLEQRAAAGGPSTASAPNDVVPPMPAVVMSILVGEGDPVERLQPLIVVAAMKMETTLSAPYSGIVSKIHCKEGDKVAAKQILMDIEKHDAEASNANRR